MAFKHNLRFCDLLFFVLVCTVGAAYTTDSVEKSRKRNGIDPANSTNNSDMEDGHVNESLSTDYTHSSAVTQKIGDELTVNATTPVVIVRNSYRLPTRWSTFCNVEMEVFESLFTELTKLTSIVCDVNQEHSGLLSLSDLRKNPYLHEGSSMRFSIHIRCIGGANISLPWPFKVNNLYKLHVEDCKIVDFLTELGSEIIQTIPDSLRVLQLRNTINVSSMSRCLHLMKNIKQMKKEAECLHEETIEDVSLRNVTFDFKMDFPIKMTDIDQNFLLDSTGLVHKCVHQHLLQSDLIHGRGTSIFTVYPTEFRSLITNEMETNLERIKELPKVFEDMKSNPVNCNCSDSMIQILKDISDKKHLQVSNSTDNSDIGRLECQSPKRLYGKTLQSLTVEMICESVMETEYFLIPMICLSIVVVAAILLLAFILRFKKEIVIILFTRFNIVLPCQTRANYDSNKKYDAFVSYSSNEEECVERLFEDLENSEDRSGPTFKFCLHHRDFIPGKTIFDNVTSSVESSRHTIILLSNHFIKSEFCLYEFQEAFRQSIMEKRRHLVIVMMEDISEADLPRDLRRCVQTFTYIRKDDRLFTERLIYALSVQQKGKTVNRDANTVNENNV